MTVYEFEIIDFQYIAAGAAVLGSDGGGSYCDADSVMGLLRNIGYAGALPYPD